MQDRHPPLPTQTRGVKSTNPTKWDTPRRWNSHWPVNPWRRGAAMSGIGQGTAEWWGFRARRVLYLARYRAVRATAHGGRYRVVRSTEGISAWSREAVLARPECTQIALQPSLWYAAYGQRLRGICGTLASNTVRGLHPQRNETTAHVAGGIRFRLPKGGCRGGQFRVGGPLSRGRFAHSPFASVKCRHSTSGAC